MEKIKYSREYFPRIIIDKLFNRSPIILKPTRRSSFIVKILEAVNKPVVCHGISWSYVTGTGTSNGLVHALNGNRRIGYKVAVWNCRRGLLTHGGAPSTKVTDIQLYIQKHQLEVFGIIESDLHGANSRHHRVRPLTTIDINQKLKIEGYNILLPQSWQSHAQARIIVYIKEGIQIKERKLKPENSDLPSISFELGLSREKKTCFNFFYREFTGGVSGLSDITSQKERLGRLTQHWKSLFKGNRDVVIMGDSNLCARQWMNDAYNHKELSNMVKDFLLVEASQQLVMEMTRSELVSGVVQRSSIDHCYSNVSDKISGPFVETVGDSDHMGVRIVKFSKSPISNPQVIRRRVYKNFSPEYFLTDIFYSNINTSVTTHDTMEGAAESFQNEFCAILDFHAPVKTIQLRKNYCPFLTQETKLIMEERNVLKEEATKSCDAILMEEFKAKAKEVKKSVENDQKLGKKKDLGDNVDSKIAWQAARNILGMSKNLAPTAIKDDIDGLVTNPAKIATKLNTYFIEKVKALRTKTSGPPTIDPVTRLKNWLSTRQHPPPPFKIKEINRQKLRSLIKKMKGGRCSGVDSIDSFSLKLAAPLIEDALLHLVNLSIKTSSFSSFWKHQLVFPLHKKQDKLQAKNYRPVSHLVQVGLLVESAVFDQIVDHFTSNNLFHINHHGGLKSHSTTTALIQLHEMFLEAAESKKLTAALLLDQSAAYDLLDHSILLLKLAAYNFHEDSIQWVKSYLSFRSQSVQVEARQSEVVELGDHAAPQGSLLGGLLFLINENDFPACRDEGSSVLFVDDDTDVVSDGDPEALVQKIQHEADLSCSWLRDNRMVVAGEKSKLLIIGTKELRKRRLGDQVISIMVDGKRVSESRSEKLLGVIVNNQMTWHEHLYGEDWRPVGENSPGLITQLSQVLVC